MGPLRTPARARRRRTLEHFQRIRQEQQNTQIERERRELRSMMDWVDTEL